MTGRLFCRFDFVFAENKQSDGSRQTICGYYPAKKQLFFCFLPGSWTIKPIFFTWTGKYLQQYYPDKQNLEKGFRVMLRSRHIFLLLISLLEIGIGVYIQQSRNRVFLFIQCLATLLLVLAHILFSYAFFYEVDLIHVPQTPAVHYATYLTLASVILHVCTKVEFLFSGTKN